MTTRTMPSDYLESLWIMWDNGIITEQQVADSVSIYGYELTSVDSSGVQMSNQTTTYNYYSNNHVEEV